MSGEACPFQILSLWAFHWTPYMTLLAACSPDSPSRPLQVRRPEASNWPCSKLTAPRPRGLLTERTGRRLLAAQHRRQHVAATVPGELICLVPTFYLGKLKGSGESGSTRPAMPPIGIPVS